MCGGGDDIVEAIAVDVIDENLRGVIHLAVQSAQSERMFDPLAVARVGGGLEPGVGPDEVRAAIAVNIAHAYAPVHGLVRNDVFGKRPPPVRSFDHFVPDRLGHRRHHRLALAVADDVVKAGGLIVAICFDEGLGHSPLAMPVLRNQTACLSNQSTLTRSGFPEPATSMGRLAKSQR